MPCAWDEWLLTDWVLGVPERLIGTTSNRFAAEATPGNRPLFGSGDSADSLGMIPSNPMCGIDATAPTTFTFSARMVKHGNSFCSRR
jgi:hypothetical protein